MYLNEVKRSILRALRQERLDHYQIAADLGTGAFLIRDELRTLRRNRLVQDRIEPNRIAWEITDRGARALAVGDQLELGA
jgi:predicted transcriptional regulator